MTRIAVRIDVVSYTFKSASSVDNVPGRSIWLPVSKLAAYAATDMRAVRSPAARRGEDALEVVGTADDMLAQYAPVST